MKHEDITWLHALDEKLWRDHRPTPRSYGWSEPIVKLSDEEWTRIRSFATDALFTMGCSDFGFSFMLRIWLSSGDPPYPSIPKDPPTRLCRIAARHLPWYCEDNTKSKPKERQDRAWEEFSALTHSTDNIRKLAEHGMEAPRSREYYEY